MRIKGWKKIDESIRKIAPFVKWKADNGNILLIQKRTTGTKWVSYIKKKGRDTYLPIGVHGLVHPYGTKDLARMSAVRYMESHPYGHNRY